MNDFSLNEIIEMAVQIEKNGYSFYDHALQKKDLSNDAEELLIMLRDEEIAHEKIFKNLRKEIDFSEIQSAGDWNMVGSYLRTITESHIFRDDQAAIQLAVNASDEKEIIRNAIAFEKDTLLFFYSLRDSVNDERAAKVIKKIIDEEAKHVVKLKKIYEKII